MADSYYRRGQDPGMSGQNQVTGPGGEDIDANPGERALTPAGAATDATTAGITVGNKPIGIGAQVGILRNPEFPAGAPPRRTGGAPPDATTAGIPVGNKQIGIGAQVGILRNLEFTAGGRSHRISTGP